MVRFERPGERQRREVSDARDFCHNRGYHTISEAPKSSDSILVCNYCDVWFTDEDKSIPYRVESL